MSSTIQTDLYETDAAYVEAWERWAEDAQFGRLKRDPEEPKLKVRNGVIFGVQARIALPEIDQ